MGFYVNYNYGEDLSKHLTEEGKPIVKFGLAGEERSHLITLARKNSQVTDANQRAIQLLNGCDIVISSKKPEEAKLYFDRVSSEHVSVFPDSYSEIDLINPHVEDLVLSEMQRNIIVLKHQGTTYQLYPNHQ